MLSFSNYKSNEFVFVIINIMYWLVCNVIGCVFLWFIVVRIWGRGKSISFGEGRRG